MSVNYCSCREVSAFSTSGGQQFVKCVVLCLSSDIPATRKAAGFVGHNAKKACSHCLKNVPRVNDHMDCSGFDRAMWPPRTHSTHCEHAYKVLSAQTKVERKRLEQEYGARYSVLYELPYYDAIRFATIDKMHNLFLGTTKHIMTIWKDCNILNKDHFQIIQQKIESINVPLDVGRIPYKIESGISGLTADQWKNWTCLYSLYVLHGVRACWWLFVQACILICQPLLTHAIIDKAFCRTVEELYGSQVCTINIHLHGHLAECLRDYGPVHSTWCFSFERYNGILGGTPNNIRSLQVEKTMINRFIQQMESQSSFCHLLQELDSFFPASSVGSVHNALINSDMYIKHLRLLKTTDLPQLIFQNDFVLPTGQMSQHALQTHKILCLTQMYQEVLYDFDLLNVSHLCYRFSRVKVAGKLISSGMAKSDRSSYICANWLNNKAPDPCRAGHIKFFFRHNITLDKDKISVQALLAYIEWYKHHPEKTFFNPPTTLWYSDFEPTSGASFMPINRIACRCAQSQIYMTFSERPYNNGQAIANRQCGYIIFSSYTSLYTSL